MAGSFSTLETNILKAKGLTDEQLAALTAAGVDSKASFETVGDAATLTELIAGLDLAVAQRIMEWAGVTAKVTAPQQPQRTIIDTADVVYCVHCSAKQPKDYKSGDLCPSCGKQAEPILACHWCGASGPGKFCRSCGSEFVPTSDYDIALLLKRDGLPKDEIPKRLASMSTVDKDQLWARIRRGRA